MSCFISSSQQAYFAFTYSSLLIGAQRLFSFSAMPLNLREPIFFLPGVVLTVSFAFSLGLIELTDWEREREEKNPTTCIKPEACHLFLAITLLMAGSQAKWQRISLLTFPTHSAFPNTRWCFWNPFHYV